MSHFRLAVLLGMTVALAPLALDTYLPAFPQIAAAFGVDHAAVGLTLSAYVAVLGAAQLVGGPLSDRYGRAHVLFSGLAVFTIASLMIAGTDSLEGMLAWRLVQAIGGGWCAVSVPAIVRDHVHGKEAARLFSLIGLMMFAAPALAPSIGSLVLVTTDWHGIFVFLAVYAVLLAVLLRATLFHTPAKPRAATPLHTLVTNYLVVLRHGATMRFIGLQAMVFSVMLVFVTHASFIYQEWFGLSNAAFSALFAANIGGMAVANLLNRRLLFSLDSLVILRAAVTVQAVTVFTLTAVIAWGNPSVWLLAPLFIIAIASMGAIAPNNMANALEFFPKLGGTASAMMGAIQFAAAGTVSAISTTLADGTLLPIGLIMGACSLAALILAFSAVATMRRMASVEADAG